MKFKVNLDHRKHKYNIPSSLKTFQQSTIKRANNMKNEHKAESKEKQYLTKELVSLQFFPSLLSIPISLECENCKLRNFISC